MKKIVLIAIALVTLQATAQEKKKSHHKEGKAERMELLKDLTPEEMATLQTKKMVLHLDLTEEQQQKIQALNLKHASLRKSKMEERLKRKESKKDEKPSKEEHLKMMNERLDHQIATKQKMKQILNDEQFEKWEKSQQSHHKKRKMMKHHKKQ